VSDFAFSYELSRKRFDECLFALNSEQLNFRKEPEMLTPGEMALHLAGCEISFVHQITHCPIEPIHEKVILAATEGVVNDHPFPFNAPEITPEFVKQMLDFARSLVEPHIKNPSNEFRDASLKSALGPMIDGTGALARIAFHPAYHHGQIYQLSQMSGFPA
jgi:hypothetical protein